MAADFNKEMDNYLSKRIGDSQNSQLVKKQKKPEFREIDEVEQELEDSSEQEMGVLEDESMDSPGFFSKIFKSLGLKRTDQEEVRDEEFEEEYPELDEDVKKVLRITFDWINRLPPETKIKFKNSQDFIEYKAILQKYGLAKEKKEEG